MTDVVVCDASAIVALLADDGLDGRWAADAVAGRVLAAPEILPFEVANVLRRLERSRGLSADQSAQAHADLLDLTIELWPYELLAPRVWELRDTLSSYDASYVAAAELAGAALATLDARLTRAPGLRCAVVPR